MPKGRKPKRPQCPHLCPVCRKRPYQHGKPTSYRCPNCGRAWILVGGELRPREPVVKVVVVEPAERPAMEWFEVELLNDWVPEVELWERRETKKAPDGAG